MKNGMNIQSLHAEMSNKKKIHIISMFSNGAHIKSHTRTHMDRH